MSAAIEASLDDAIAVNKDSLPSTTTRVIKQQPLIQVYFPIIHLRSVDLRLPVARTATACGIHYSYIFLASSLLLSSLDMPKISRATQARLLRKSSTSIPTSASQSTSLSTSQQQSIPPKDISTNNNDTITPSTKSKTLEQESNNSNPIEACNSSSNNDNDSHRRDIVTKKDDDGGSGAVCQLATEEAVTATATTVVDEIKDNIHASKTLEPAIPTPHLSTPPSRSSSSSRIPIRKSNSMPTAKSPEAVTTRRATITNTTTTSTSQHKQKQDMQQQIASPKSSTISSRNKTSVNRTSSSKSMATTTTNKVREADVPMPKKPTPSSPPLRNNGTHKKSGKDHNKQNIEDEEDEAPVRITAQERRRRENMRAQQIKMWRVREEREARDARTIARRKMMERPTSRNKEPSPPPTPPRRAVKFNLKRNKVIEITQ